jgi:hypothetical protein
MSDSTSLEGTIRTMLVERGLFDQEAKEVLAMLKDRPAMEALADRWGDDVAGYPSSLLAAVWTSGKEAAVEWIDKNKPKHLARPLFADSPGPPKAEAGGLGGARLGKPGTEILRIREC